MTPRPPLFRLPPSASWLPGQAILFPPEPVTRTLAAVKIVTSPSTAYTVRRHARPPEDGSAIMNGVVWLRHDGLAAAAADTLVDFFRSLWR